MKKIIYIAMVALASCNDSLPTTHEVRYSDDGKDSVVYVKYFDGKQYNEIYMNYQQFEVLFNEDGYEGVNDYYMSHGLPLYWLRAYMSYKRH